MSVVSMILLVSKCCALLSASQLFLQGRMANVSSDSAATISDDETASEDTSQDSQSLHLIQTALEAGSDRYKLRINPTGRSDAWKLFRNVWETRTDGETVEVKGICACCECKKVYRYRHESGVAYGTKNLSEHVSRCRPHLRKSQTTLEQVVPRIPAFSLSEKAEVRMAAVWFCASGYHSFRSIEDEGLVNLLQVFVNLAAIHGKFDVSRALPGRKTVSDDCLKRASDAKLAVASELKQPLEDATVSLCTDMYTDDYRKRSYIDVHAFYVNRSFELKHVLLAVQHFGVVSHTAENVYASLSEICSKWNVPIDETPVTTDHGANIVASLKGRVRLDCFAHRLNTVLESAWSAAKDDSADLSLYDDAVAALCAHCKRATAIQEQLPCSLKSGGDTRPWLSLYNRAKSVEQSYDKLLELLGNDRERLRLVIRVDPVLNKAIRCVLETITGVFEKLQFATKPTLQYVVPSYYVICRKFTASMDDSEPIRQLKNAVLANMNRKFYTSIKAYHWIACFLDPTFRDFAFMPTVTGADRKFKQEMLEDLDHWLLLELTEISPRLRRQKPTVDVDESSRKKLADDVFSELRAEPGVAISTDDVDLPASGTLRAELTKYKGFTFRLDYDANNPLRFWQIYAAEFPYLSQLARHVFSIAASSAQSERDFSSIGLTISQLRTRIAPEKVEALELLRSAGKTFLSARFKEAFLVPKTAK